MTPLLLILIVAVLFEAWIILRYKLDADKARREIRWRAVVEEYNRLITQMIGEVRELPQDNVLRKFVFRTISRGHSLRKIFFDILTVSALNGYYWEYKDRLYLKRLDRGEV